MNKKLLHLIPSVALYIFAGLLLFYTIWSYTYCADIISQAKAVGQLAANGNEYDIASFYMGNCGQYFVYALLLAAAGLLLHRKQPVLRKTIASVGQQKDNAADDELDEWFNEAESADDENIFRK